jgi:hypothetical protein
VYPSPRHPGKVSGRTAAALLRSRGLALCRPDPGGKAPRYAGWPARSLEPHDFGDGDLVGILAGPLSDANRPGHALVIVDLDAPAPLELADRFLPPTAMIDGRPAKPLSHRYFLVPNGTIPEEAHSTAPQAASAAAAECGHAGPKLRHFVDGDGVNLVDFLGTGGQCLCPPSLHPGGERREWTGGEMGQPAVVPYPVLWSAVCRLAEACGWRPRPAPRTAAAGDGRRSYYLESEYRRAAAYLRKVPPAVSGRGGHAATLWAARVLTRGFDLGPDVAFRLLREVYNPRCEPPWSEAELWHKVQDADENPFKLGRGWLLRGRPDGAHDVICFRVEVG